MSTARLSIMIIVGEPSGDALGAQLIAGLNSLAAGRIDFSGVGGPLMEAEGFTSLFSLDDTSVMGLKEVVPKIPAILARVREAADYAIKTRPDVVVLIDSPDFTHRIARRLKRLAPELTIVKYVAPQVWASRPWRAKKLSEFVDHLLALLPFEPAFFERYGLQTHFVGHPVVERIPDYSDDELSTFRSDARLTEGDTVLTVLPGSRSNEIRFLGPIFGEVVEDMARTFGNLRVLVPTVPHVEDKVRELTKDWPGTPHVFTDPREKFMAFRVAGAGLAASGTVTTEAALAGLPIVVGYKVGWLTQFFARMLMVSKYMTLLNLIADREVIPEFLPQVCTPQNLSGALKPLLSDTPERRQQIGDVRHALQLLGAGSERPSVRAAETVLKIADARAPSAA